MPPAKPVADAALAAVVNLMIDARGPAEMTRPGFVDRWNFDVPWADGPLTVRKLRPAIFGNGYDRQINPASIRAALKTEKSGTRIVTVDIPKNDFYLHQWSLATNGQNTLGINAGVALLDPATSPPGFPPAFYWSLMNNGFHDNDAGGLGVLQLTPAKSGTWSVRIY